jgi:hypothetical protein
MLNHFIALPNWKSMGFVVVNPLSIPLYLAEMMDNQDNSKPVVITNIVLTFKILRLDLKGFLNINILENFVNDRGSIQTIIQ